MTNNDQIMRRFYMTSGYEYGDVDEVVWQAVKEKGLGYYENIDPKYFDNKEFILEAIKNEKETDISIQYASKRLKDDKDVVLAAVNKKDIHALQYASKRLKDDKDVILAAVTKNGVALSYASKRLKDDYDVVLRAIARDPSLIKYASIRIQSQYSNTIKIGSVSIKYLGVYTQDEKVKIGHNCKIGLQAIQNSPLDSFKSVLKDAVIVIGKPKDLESLGLPLYPKQEATYYSTADIVVIKDFGKDMSASIVHELAHRFHHKILPMGYNNKEIRELFKKATMSKKECLLVRMPSLGSPLSNLIKGSRWWWSVKRASSDFYLKKIIDDGNTFIYESDTDERWFTKEKIIKMLECPSEYGATDEFEFFAEMCALITLGLVKPSQKKIAYHFIELVNSLT